jgi:hypothetical protein
MPTSDLANIDTTPGSGHSFAPPACFAGGEEEYRSWLRDNLYAGQQLAQPFLILGRWLAGCSQFAPRVCIVGPFATVLSRSAKNFERHIRTSDAKAA